MVDADRLVTSRVAVDPDRSVIEALERLAEQELRDQRGGELLFDLDRPLIEPRDAAAGTDLLEAVGLVDDVVVGFARCRVLVVGAQRVAMIDTLYVHPDARGIGVGAEMLGRVRRWASDRSCAHLESQVLPGNRDAKNFFERMGMVTRRMQVSTAL